MAWSLGLAVSWSGYGASSGPDVSQNGIEFIGIPRPFEDLDRVMWAAAHDRRPSAVVQAGDRIYLLNGRFLDSNKDEKLRVGSFIKFDGISARVLETDSGNQEISPIVARSLQEAEALIQGREWSRAVGAVQQAIQRSQDVEEIMLVADQIVHLRMHEALRGCYTRAIDLCPSAEAILRVAENAAKHQAAEDSIFAYKQAIQKADERELLQKIGLSAKDFGYQACALRAFEKAARAGGSNSMKVPMSSLAGLERLSERDRQLYFRLDRAFRDPETNVSLVESDLPKLIGDGEANSPLLTKDAQGRRTIDLLCHYLEQPIARIDELRSLRQAMVGGLDLSRSVLADVIRQLACPPGTGIDSHSIFQGFGTNACVAAVTQGSMARLYPGEYVHLALGLFFDGRVRLLNGVELFRTTRFEKDARGLARLRGRTPLNLVLQNSLMMYAFEHSKEVIPASEPVERRGFTSNQIMLLQDAVFGCKHVVVRMERENRNLRDWERIKEVINRALRLPSSSSYGAQPCEWIASRPIALSIRNPQGGFHFLMVSGYSHTGHGSEGYLLMDPEGFRYFYSFRELANIVHEVVLPQKDLDQATSV